METGVRLTVSSCLDLTGGFGENILERKSASRLVISCTKLEGLIKTDLPSYKVQLWGFRFYSESARPSHSIVCVWIANHCIELAEDVSGEKLCKGSCHVPIGSKNSIPLAPKRMRLWLSLLPASGAPF